MTFEDITVVDVQVEPGAAVDSYRFTYHLSRLPERFWPECFMSAYNVQQGLRRMELNESTLAITLAEGEAEAYTTTVGATVAAANAAYRTETARRVSDQQRRLDSERERRESAEALRQQAKRALGI